MIKKLICLIFGHKFTRKVCTEVTDKYDTYEIKVVPFCLRCYRTWINVLNLFSNKIYGLENKRGRKIKINSCGYAELYMGNTKVLKSLKRKLLEFNLPLLKRKWDKIDLKYRGQYEKAEERHEKIKEMLQNKHTYKEIMCEVGITSAIVSKIRKRLREGVI